MRIRLITAALPYVNNVPHIGNIVGSHLPADIFARYSRLKGYLTLFIGGTDEHGTPIEVEAIKKKTTPRKLTNYFYKIHKEIYDWFNFSYDNFSRTSKSEIHYKVTQEMFLEMFKNGFITEKEQELPYDPEWNKFLPDRYVVGKCPYCGYEKARGDQCEKCGRLLDPKELIEPKNAITGKPVIFKKTRHLFLDLSKLEKDLRYWLEKKKGVFTEQAISMALSWIKEGLKARSITRDISWGVPVPYKELWEITKEKIFKKLDFTSKEKFIESFIQALKEENLVVPSSEIAKIKSVVEENWPKIDHILNKYNYFEDYKNKVFYVWFDAPIGYISFTIEKVKEKFRIEDLEKFEKIEFNENTIKYRIEDDSIIIEEYDNEFLKNLEGKIKYLLEKYNKKEAILKINWKNFWNSEIYHFIGKDNIPFHTIFWPGMIIAFNRSFVYFKEIRNGNEIKYKEYYEGNKFVVEINNNKIYGINGEKIVFLVDKKEYINMLENYAYSKKLKELYIKPLNLEVQDELEKRDYRVIELKNKILSYKINLPYDVVGLNYLNYEGRKISKSQNWGIFCENLPKSNLDSDYWRFYLSLLIPENKDTDFRWEEFREIINKELVNNIGNLIHRVLTFAWKNFKEIEEFDKNILEIIIKYKDIIENLFERVELTKALRKIIEFAHLGNKIFQERKPWETKDKKFIGSMLHYVKALAIFLYPYIPKSSKRILEYLGLEKFSWDDITKFDKIKVVKEPKPLFKKIDNILLKELKEKTTKITEFKIA